MIVIMSRAVRLCACLSPLWLATAAFRPPPAPRVLRGPRAVLRRGVRRGDDDAGAATGEDDDDGARLPATRRAFVARSFATVAAGGAAALPRAVPPARAADGRLLRRPGLRGRRVGRRGDVRCHRVHA